MSSLLERLQLSQLHGPTSRKFDLKEWATVAKPISSEDANLFTIAVLMHRSLDVIRRNLSFVEDKAYSATRRRHEIVGWANHQSLVVGRLAQKEADRLVPHVNGTALDRLADVRLTLPLGRCDVDGLVETIIDSCGQLLLTLAADTTTVTVDDPLVSYRQLVQDANLAIAYGTLELLWLDVVWNGYRFHPSSGFAPEDVLRLTQRAQSSHRHLMTTMQSYAVQLARMRSLEASLPETRFPMLVARFDGGRCILTVESPDFSTLAARSVMLVSTLPCYYQALADEQRKKFPTLTLNLVTRAYALFVGMAKGINDEAQAVLDGSGESLTELRDLAPTFGRVELTQGLCSCLAIDALTAAQIIRFFTGAGLGVNERLDPWAAPLVDLDGERLTCFISALQHASLRRLADLWLSRMGFDLEFKGDAFENEIRLSLRETLEDSPLRSITQVLNRDFHLAPGYASRVVANAPGARKEEIDLVVVLGDQVLVGEIKCFLQPGNPLDHHNHWKKLVEAAGQIRRKAEAVRSLDADFRARAAQYGLTLPSQFNVVPVVVINHAFDVGHVIDGIPVVDQLILDSFFDGGLPRNAILSPQGEIEKADIEHFYLSIEEAPERIASYLANPPQLKHLRNAVVPCRYEVMFPALPDSKVAVLNMELRVGQSI